MKILHVVGARPNFMKAAAVISEMAKHPQSFQQVLVHTGQHYDDSMSRVFFDDLGMPVPDEFLAVGSGTHAEQTARVMLAFEPAVRKHRPDWVFVVGDVNSTVACALVCAKLGIPVAHVEAGLRSRDRTMPEEINRIVTDQIADLLLTPSRDGDENLLREGVAPEKIHFVGNVMIDTLVRTLPLVNGRATVSQLGLPPKGYALVTLHRPANVDEPGTLREILAALEEMAGMLPVVFPVHPRTRQRMASLHAAPQGGRVRLLDPVGYLDCLALMREAAMVVTDSGGVQEETTFLGVPCLTVRPNTERPVTIDVGTNRLVEASRAAIVGAARESLSAGPRPARVPEFWDGRAAQRIVEVMLCR